MCVYVCMCVCICVCVCVECVRMRLFRLLYVYHIECSWIRYEVPSISKITFSLLTLYNS